MSKSPLLPPPACTPLSPHQDFHDDRCLHRRCGGSVWTRGGPDVERRAARNLRDDLASGRWAERDRDLVDLDAAELGLRLLVA
ncbi:hypothetical protein [Streptosporangium sp. NPDC000509]|uniref:hypothetical protein n=1 Tax=Streptosporangium sp. NPDC000509 TaxID=3366186 RepID=UPI0036BE0FE0